MFNRTSNPSFGKIETNIDNPDLWAGWGNEQIKGDDISPIIKSNIRTNPNLLEKVLAQYALNNQQNQGNTTTPVINNGFEFGEFFANNKWLILGGVAVVGYFLLSGGLAASDRTITSVTRYAPKK